MSDVLQAFISQGGSLLGYEYFTELRIAVGSGDDADLFLDAPGIEPVHAWVERSGKRITVRAEGEALVLVNRVPVGEARLRGFDEVSIGPYSVKFKAVRAGATPVPAPPVPGAPAPSEPYLGASSGVLAVQPTAPISPAMLAPLRVAVEQESESESETESETESESETETESETEPEPESETEAETEAEPEPEPETLPEVEAMPACFWDEDEEEEEEDWTPAFSLPDKIAEEHVAEEDAPRPARVVQALEVYRVYGQELDEAVLVVPGGRFTGPRGSPVVEWPEAGPPKLADGTLPEDGASMDVEADGETYRVRRAEVPVAKGRPPPEGRTRRVAAITFASVVGHVLVIGLGVLLQSEKKEVPKPDYDRFAKIEILEPTEEKKPEEEKPEEEPEAEEAQPEDQPKEKKDKQPKKKGKRKKSKFAGGGGVLGALAKFNRSRRGKTSIAAMVSGIAAVRSSGGVRAFTVAGTGEGGVLGGKLVVGGRAGGPGMRTGTRSVADLFAGGKKRASLKGRKKSKVRGNVRKAGKRQIRSRGSGMLDKAAIAKVVNKNIGQVRYCYERTLLKAPNVRGKVILEWTIAPTGKVRSVSTSFSSVNADALTRCIMRKIKGWKFPKPKGGQVIVAYPFVFNSVGF